MSETIEKKTYGGRVSPIRRPDNGAYFNVYFIDKRTMQTYRFYKSNTLPIEKQEKRKKQKTVGFKYDARQRLQTFPTIRI